jgi:hypothetical protein
MVNHEYRDIVNGALKPCFDNEKRWHLHNENRAALMARPDADN